MSRYLIKATYISGPHTGSVYYMEKGGYVCRDNALQYYKGEDSSYASLGTALRICKMYAKENEQLYNIETQDIEYRAKKGRTPYKFRIHELQKFEPYEI